MDIYNPPNRLFKAVAESDVEGEKSALLSNVNINARDVREIIGNRNKLEKISELF